MAAWTTQDVKDIAPEFAELDATILDRYIGYAELQVNPAAFGVKTKLVGSLLTAHLLTVLPPAGGSRTAPPAPVQSRSVGQVSVSYAVMPFNPANVRASLTLSRYGAEYARLVSLAAFGAQVL